MRVEGYDIYRHDRDASGGGVALYVNSSLPNHRRDDITDPQLEILGVVITPKHAKSFVILSWYRPPTPGVDTCSFEALTRLIKRIDSEGKEVILIGDINCDYKKPKDGNTRKLKLIYSGFQFEQLITDHTRVFSTTSSSGETRTTKTIIDHVATNRPSYISLAGVIKVGITDHYMVSCIRKLNAKSKIRKLQNKAEYRSFKNYDKEAFLSEDH